MAIPFIAKFIVCCWGSAFLGIILRIFLDEGSPDWQWWVFAAMTPGAMVLAVVSGVLWVVIQ
jgi:hypothetical protein